MASEITRRLEIDSSAKADRVSEGSPFSRRSFMKLAGLFGVAMAGGPAVAQDTAGGNLEYRNYQSDKMIYRRLGKTNLMVSGVGMGGFSNWGTGQWASHDPAAYEAMLARLIELGVNIFETAPQYGTEPNYAFLCKPENRDKVFVCTKIHTVDTTKIKSSVENSLKNFGTDYIDILYIHRGRGLENNCAGAKAAFGVLEQLRTEGKIRFMGMTSHEYTQCTSLVENCADQVDVIMGQYMPLAENVHKKVATKGTIPQWDTFMELAKSKDIGITMMKALCSATEDWKTRESQLKNDAEAWARIKPFVDEGFTMPQACIRWSLSNENVHSTMNGMRTIAEAEEDVLAGKPFASRATPHEAATAAGTRFTVNLRIPSGMRAIRLHLNREALHKKGSLSIYDISGRMVKEVWNGTLRNNMTAIWHGIDSHGNVVAPGFYIARIRTGLGVIARIFSSQLFRS